MVVVVRALRSEFVREDVVVVQSLGEERLSGGLEHLWRAAEEGLAGGTGGQMSLDGLVDEAGLALPAGALLGFGEREVEMELGAFLRHPLEFGAVEELLLGAGAEEEPAFLGICLILPTLCKYGLIHY